MVQGHRSLLVALTLRLQLRTTVFPKMLYPRLEGCNLEQWRRFGYRFRGRFWKAIGAALAVLEEKARIVRGSELVTGIWRVVGAAEDGGFGCFKPSSRY